MPSRFMPPVFRAAAALLAALALSATAETIVLRPPGTKITITAGQAKAVNLDELFTLVRLTCELGTFDAQLYPLDAPATTANFLKYADNGCYTNTFVHRSVAGFVVQAGGFTVDAGATDWLHTGSTGGYDKLHYAVQDWPVLNEPGLSNTAGTLAMAKLGGDPNSATNQWFVNLGDNSSNLDAQNGGFTVFGKVLGGGMTVVNAIAAVPVRDESARVSAFDSLPVIGYVDTSNPGRLVAFTAVKRVTGMVYSPAAPAPTSAVVARISGKTLTLTAASGAADGTVTVSADVNGNTYQMEIPYHVVSTAPATVVPLRFFPPAKDAATASVTLYPGGTATFDFSNYFSLVRFTSYKWGAFDLQLYPVHTPNAVQNFLGYVNAGTYANTIIETVNTDTSTTPATRTFAWGGRLKAAAATWPGSLALTGTNAAVADDTGTMPFNTRGTIFLYRGTANGGTNQWIINLDHNINRVSGYATFGEVLGSGMTDVVDVMSATPMGTLWNNNGSYAYFYNSSATPAGYTAAKNILTNLPVDNYVSASSFGTPAGFTSLARVTGLAYSATSQATGFNAALSGQTLTITASTTPSDGGAIQVNGTAGGKTYRLLVPVAVNTAKPTVATAAAADPVFVSGATANLSVLGAYGGGEALLTYTWDAGDAAPGPVTFSPNGTNAAKNCTATFTKPGTYNLRVTIANTIGGTVTSTVAVTVGPEVAVPAAATAPTVTGTTTGLSVLGGNGNGGEAALTYTWDAGAGAPATVVFTPNGTNAAKITTATFSKAGSYNLRVTIRNAVGITSTSTVAVTVTPTLTSIAIAPEAAVLAPDAAKTFTATALDQFGDAMSQQPASFAWSVTGTGVIDGASGAYTAPVAAESATVTATSGGVSGTAPVFVIAESATATIHLEPGWNLVSMPLEPEQQDMAALFGGAVTPGSLWRWDASRQRLVRAARLHAFDAGWVHAPAATDVEVTGAGPAAVGTIRQLKAGWNLCGPAADNVTPALTGADFWEWKAGPAGRFTGVDTLKTGRGYWIRVPADTTWDAATGAPPP
jgi:cyclophilin family peptidyl-prolyl cis-trans isomerase